MEQYISKTALVAEIERKIKEYNTPVDRLGSNNIRLNECKDILAFINSLEAKEVALDKEITNYISGNFFGSETMGFFSNRTKEEPNDQDIALCAKHFFELGLRAAQKGE